MTVLNLVDAFKVGGSDVDKVYLGSTEVWSSSGAPGEPLPLTYAEEVLADSPFVYWKFDDTSGTTVVDYSGNGRHGGYTGTPEFGKPPVISGDSGRSTRFYNDQVTGPGTGYASPQFTVEAWLTLEEPWLDFAYLTGGTGTGGFTCHTDNGGRFYFGSTGAGSVSTPVGYVDNVARHYVFVQGATTLKAYVNGVEVASAAATALSSATQDIALRFSVSGQWGTRWRGRAGHFAYYKTALSADRIWDHYAAAQPRTYVDAVLFDQPAAFYRMDSAPSGLANVSADSSGNSRPGTYVGSPVRTSPGLTAGGDGCVVLNGSSQWVTVPTGAWMNPAAITVEAVLRRSATGSHGIMDRDRSGARQFQFRINSNRAELLLWTTGSGLVTVVGTTTLAVDTTYHVAATFDGTTIRLYVNGVQEASAAATGTPVPVAADLAIGVLAAGSTVVGTWPFNGKMDETAYYGTALSPTRVAAHAAAVAGGGYADAVLADSPLGYWRMSDDPGASGVADVSGNGRHSAFVGSGLALAAGATVDGNSSLTFSTGNHLLVADAAWMDTSTFTLEAWVKTTSTGAYQAIWDRDPAGGTRPWQFRMSPTGKVEFVGIHGGVTTTATTASVNDGIWHHVAATVDGTALKLYVDGILSGSGTLAAALSADFTTPLRIGQGPSVPAWVGQIDEAAYYGTALTPDRVMAHYVAGLSSNLYVREVLKDSPHAFFLMEEDSLVTTWDDSGSLGEDWQVTYGARGQQLGGPLGSAVSPGGSGAVATRAGIPAALAGANMSASVWFYKPAAFVSGYLMKVGEGPNGWGFGLGHTTMDNSGNNLIVITDGIAWHPSDVAFSTGWHHVVAVRGAGNAITVYDNGAVKWSGNLSSPNTPTGGMTVGGLYGGTPGQRALASTVLVSQAAWFPAALTAGDVTALYNSGAGSDAALAARNPLIRLDMDEAGDWGFADETPAGRDLVLAGGGPAATGIVGPGVGKAAQWAAGSTGYLTSVSAVAQPTTATFECWFKYSANPAAETIIQAFGGSGAYGATSALSILTDGKISLMSYAVSNAMYANTAAALTKDVWHHIVASVGAAGMKVRIDGVTVATNTRVASSSFVGDSRYNVRAGMPFAVPGATSGGFELGPHAAWHNVQLSDTQTDAHYLAGIPTVASATVTVPAGKVASTLTNFPIRVDLAHMPAGWWTDVVADGGNVRVKQSGTVIPFDLVSINTATRTGELFFKATLTTAANVFTIDKSGSSLLPATDTNGRIACWADYYAVFLGGSLINRATSTGSLTLNGTVGTTTIDGSTWWDLPGGGNGGYTIDGITKGTQFSFMASFITDKITGDQHFLGYGPVGTSNTTVVSISLDDSRLSTWNSSDSFLSGGPVTTVGTRYRALVTYDSGVAAGRKVYRNGALGVSGVGPPATRPGGTTVGLYVGMGVIGSANTLDGRINYVALRPGILTPDWIAAEYVSWETPASFYTVT